MKAKAEEFKKAILREAVRHIGLEKASTGVGTVKFKDMMENEVLKKVDLSSYEFDEAVLLESVFVFSRDSSGGFYVEMLFQEPRDNLQ